jgi:hypothetical protein
MYDEVDIKLTEDGDLALDGNGDFDTVSNEDCVAQDIQDRLRSNAPEWYHHPRICANFEDVKGEPNTRETGERVEDMALYALTNDGRIQEGDVIVRAVPVSTKQIDLHAFVTTPSGNQVLSSREIKL